MAETAQPEGKNRAEMGNGRQLASLRPLVRAILLFACALSVCGCFEDAGKDVAACTIKATDIYKPTQVGRNEQSQYYVRNCMLAAGYQSETTDVCKDPFGALLAFCWYPNNWWERLMRGMIATT